MFAGLASLLTSLLSNVLTAFFVKALVSILLFVCLQFLIPVVLSLIPDLSSMLGTKLSALSDVVLYGLWYVDFDDIFPLYISALATRFLIRRLPLVG